MAEKKAAKKKPVATGALARASSKSRSRLGSQDADPTRFKRILLFSDGTGNKSANLMKTNVWRMYEMVDLGPAPEGEVVQVGFYSNGVGTSNFEPIAALGGIFGIGLKRNVLTLYDFLCRTYRPGDEILAFGFSRGAFTIRMLVHLVASQGVIKYDNEMSEAELRRQSREVYRRMHGEWRLNTPLANGVRVGLRWIFKTVRDGIARLQKLPVEPEAWQNPTISFVGLWDTVAAYGGPVVELTRAIDDWIWPLTMPDYRLSTKVRCARHALALDDKRDSFQPLLWDETVEEDRDADSPRLKQVWFTGMHADVGGGYPDDSLSYVSLTWMIEELGQRVRLLDTSVARAYDLANDYGPTHNSRQGIGAYYRYQPRRIEAFLDPPTPGTLGLRDPNVRKVDLDTKAQRLQGLITVPRIHESVFRRLLDGTDGYAPIALPRRVNLVRRPARTPHADRLPPLPEALQDDLDMLADEAESLRKSGKADPLDRVWDRVWARRTAYFVTVVLTLVLILFPSQPQDSCGVLGCGDDRLSLSPVTTAAKGLLPGMAHSWIDAWGASPRWFIAFAAGIYLSMRMGAALEGRTSDRVRHAWAEAVGRIASATDEGRTTAGQAEVEIMPRPRIKGETRKWWSRIRDGGLYQGTVQRLKWRWTPKLVGPGFILVAMLFAVSFVTQLRIFWWEESQGFCPSGRPGPISSYAANRTCNGTGYTMQADHEYQIRFVMSTGAQDWRDRGPVGEGVVATPAGVNSLHESWRMTAATPLKRVVSARYLQPIAVLRAKGTQRPHVMKLDPVPQGKDVFVARLRAPVTGAVSLFANDAVPPWPFPVDTFYARNLGVADVELCEISVDCPEDQHSDDASLSAGR